LRLPAGRQAGGPPRIRDDGIPLRDMWELEREL